MDNATATPTIDRPTLDEAISVHNRYQIHPTRTRRATSSPEHRALATAAEEGRVLRGGKTGQASIRTLNALARRGLLTLVAHPGPRRYNWSHGTITDLGRRELARLDNAN